MHHRSTSQSRLLLLLLQLLLFNGRTHAAIIKDTPVLLEVVYWKGDGIEVVDPAKWTHFPTGAPVPSIPPTPWPTMPPTPMVPSDYVLMTQGSLSTCPGSTTTNTPEAECLDAAVEITDYNFPYYLNPRFQYMSQTTIPCGCYIWHRPDGSKLVEFNGRDTGCTADASTEMICKVNPAILNEGEIDGVRWLKVFGHGTLTDGMNTTVGGNANDISDPSLWAPDTMFGEFFIRRVCKDCAESHRNIIYKRLTPLPAGFNVEDLFTRTWSSANNVLNVDFELYSGWSDARLEVNKWTYCNYDDTNVAFPRDCGPNGMVPNQWTDYYASPSYGKQNYAFYVWANNPQQDAVLTYLGEVPPVGGFLLCQGDCDTDSQCMGNLVCFQRSMGTPNVPGCQGNADTMHPGYGDYCVEPGY